MTAKQCLSLPVWVFSGQMIWYIETVTPFWIVSNYSHQFTIRPICNLICILLDYQQLNQFVCLSISFGRYSYLGRYVRWTHKRFQQHMNTFELIWLRLITTCFILMYLKCNFVLCVFTTMVPISKQGGIIIKSNLTLQQHKSLDWIDYRWIPSSSHSSNRPPTKTKWVSSTNGNSYLYSYIHQTMKHMKTKMQTRYTNKNESCKFIIHHMNRNNE